MATEREAFEEWYRKHAFQAGDRRGWEGVGWAAWQARAALASAPEPEPVSPMAKMAQALRDKAAAEKASFDARVQSGEWGPVPEAWTEADCQPEHVAQVEGDAAVRILRWNKNVGAFDYPVGTKLYAASAALASAPAAAPVSALTYSSTQATECAGCGVRKHTPLRVDAMGGYVCLTCIDNKLGSMLGEFGHAEPAQPAPQAGATEHLWSLVEAYSSARTVACDPASTVTAQEHAHARMLRMEVTLRQAFAAHPTEQPSQDAQDLDWLDRESTTSWGGDRRRWIIDASSGLSIREVIAAARAGQGESKGGATNG